MLKEKEMVAVELLKMGKYIVEIVTKLNVKYGRFKSKVCLL
jgi:hypothetical protein